MNRQTDILPHHPVLLDQMLEHIAAKKGGSYLDCTFGAGGYSKAILESCNCSVTALDQDPFVAKYANEVQKQYGSRFDFIKGNFADATEILKDKKYDGIVLDLGISSMQVDEGKRGFSFMYDGPLDMRMSSSDSSAAEFIATASEEEIADVIYKYGQERYSRKIARYIVEERINETIDTTLKLAIIVRRAIGFSKSKIDPATKTFQAIRIYINKELEVLERFLSSFEKILNIGGRLVIVSFHSLEDSIVKNFFKQHSYKKIARSKYAKTPEEIQPGKWLKTITTKAIVPTNEEIKVNYRSRSAKLRVVEKIGEKNAT